MIRVFILLAAASRIATAAPLDGVVQDSSGRPIANAAVYLEAGLDAPLLNARSGGEGAFHFDNAPNPPYSVMAVAEGYAFGGMTLNTAKPHIAITLGAPASLKLRVIGDAKDPVQGAQVLRAALLGNEKVSIPYVKLAAGGINMPISDANGRFTVGALPLGVDVVLKIAHPQYAQEGTDRLRAGEREIELRLSRGIMVEGTVLSASGRNGLAKAQVLLRNAQPPNDTTQVIADDAGHYVARLKPGVYGCRAQAEGFATQGWRSLSVSGQEPSVRFDLEAGPLGGLQGIVRDAATEKPLAGVKVSIQSDNAVAAILYTNADGLFSTQAAQGEYVIVLDPIPNYFPPGGRPKVRVVANQTLDVPGLWLAPIPPYKVQLLDDKDTPAPGVIVTLLRPYQFGWKVADAEGRVELNVARLPSDGKILGLAEHPSQPLGALFILTRETKGEAKARLLPLGKIAGRVVNEKGRAMNGAVVGALFPGETAADLLPLWRTVAGRDGRFAWDYVLPGLPQRCVAHADGAGEGESATFSLNAGGVQQLADIALNGASKESSQLGQRIDLPGLHSGKPAVVFYTTAADAPAVIAGAESAQRMLGDTVHIAVVIDGAFSQGASTATILQGKRPGPAGTLVLDTANKVVLETFGLPPVMALKSLASQASR